jgi:hypothetical protein
MRWQVRLVMRSTSPSIYRGINPRTETCFEVGLGLLQLRRMFQRAGVNWGFKWKFTR